MISVSCAIYIIKFRYYIVIFFELRRRAAGSFYHVHAASKFDFWEARLCCDAGDGLIVSASMRRSFHLVVVQRSSASVSR